jgi:glycosyltransferase involved in cell wall biosynthesis
LKKNIIILNSHPIQYFAPLYKELAKEKDIDLTVYYCSDHSLKGNLDKQFGTVVSWDIPLLDGYKYKFLKNYALKPSIYTFWGLFNFGIIRELAKAPKGLVIVFGWSYLINIITVVVAKLYGHKAVLRGEAPLHFENKKANTWKFRLRKLFLNQYFKKIDYFLYIGQQNKAFYKHYNIPDEMLKFSPYCVDNYRFQQESRLYKENLVKLKNELNIPVDKIVVFSSGKFIEKKRPMDLLRAIKKVNKENVILVLMGDGELRPMMEDYIEKNNLKNVVLTGFINQSQISKYYAIADIYVMPSGIGETWGLSTNEAMNFGLPVILSDEVGCGADLIIEGKNGFTFPVGNTDALANMINHFIEDNTLRIKAGEESLRIIENYSYEQTIKVLGEI